MNAKSLLDQASAFNLLRDIVARKMPRGESVVFGSAGPGMIAEYLATGSLRLDSEGPKTFEFGPGEMAALQCIPVLIGTLKAGIELAREMRASRSAKPHPDEAREKWRKRLVEEGLSPEKAEEIAAEFHQQLEGLIKK
jgi:hypothetical protein